MQTVQIYIYVDGVINRIELFKDEKISVTSSIQNFNDLGKLFTDYSQSFTIPASKHNNAIFRHWYESAVGETDLAAPQNVDGAFDHRIKYYGYIEIDTIPFRDGKFTMQKANKKNGFIESYTINFVGNLVQLKDKFKEDKLNVLEGYEELNFEYNINNVVAVSRPNIKFPMIGSTRRFEYETGTSSDITTNTGAIYLDELFPAIRISKIFEYIENTYDLNFEGDFLTYTQFKDLFLYCKNSEEFNFFSAPQSPDFTSTTPATFPEFDLALDQCTISFALDPLALRLESWIKIFPTNPTIKYNVEILDNGQTYARYTDLEGDSDLGYYSKYRSQESTINGEPITRRFTYRITSEQPMTYEAFVNLKRNAVATGANYFYRTANSYTNTTSGDLEIRRYIPDLTVESFLSAIVKALNLVVIPLNENTFKFQPLESWYQEGTIVDLTKYIKSEDIEINKPNLFRQVSFKYEKSDNVLNTNYRNRENLDYGDLIFDNPNSAYTENYEVKLPFENIMWERYTDTNFLTATCWDINLQPYVPKPVIMYFNGGQSLGATGDPIKYTTNGTTFNVETTYPRFSNEIALGSNDLAHLQTLNFGNEISTWFLGSAPNGLFQEYYSDSIFNIYNQRTRVIKAKAKLDTFWLSSLKLNDRVIVSNKRYLINTMTTDLTTGEVDFELINDFRNLNSSAVGRFSNIEGLEIDNTLHNIEFLIFRTNYDTFNVVSSGGFLSYPLSSGNIDDIVLKVTIPANTSGVDRDDTIALQYYREGVLTEIKIPIYQDA
jgi:hypothetical protein